MSDPLAKPIGAIVQSAHAPADVVGALLSIRSIFGDDLPSDQRFVGAVLSTYNLLTAGNILPTAAAAAVRGIEA